ncbi:hypothetical protein CVH13_01034 [Dehalococcoides mccartyi]|uniref:Uncharacterized protein n=1 Tax=Dehalococcoides mccartyi TaxID=61435 RepID=A0A2J1DWP8_9CHLR|nr:hypothetical protein CVH13_01034 [Dehalococcoides mccartyi]
MQIKEQDLNKLLPLLPDGNLTFSNLSSLFAASRLMRKMKLKVDDYIMLTDLTGLDVSNSPADTLDFVEAVNSLNKSPLKLADVQFLLRHEAGNLADREIKDDKIKSILEKLQKDYQSNFSANKSLFNANMTASEQKEILQNALARLSGVSEEDVKTFLKFIERDWTSPNNAKTFTDGKLSGLLNTIAIKANIDALAAAPGPDISSEQKNLVQAFLDAIAGYQLQAGKQTLLEQILAATFKADLELVKIVLKYALLKQPAPGAGFLSGILSADALIDVDITHTIPVFPAVTAVAFPDQYRALRLAHKLFPLVNSFKLENSDVESVLWGYK